jgi:hypothetical protein
MSNVSSESNQVALLLDFTDTYPKVTESTTVSFHQDEDYLSARLVASLEELLSIVEQLAWLEAAYMDAKPEDRPCYRTPAVAIQQRCPPVVRIRYEIQDPYTLRRRVLSKMAGNGSFARIQVSPSASRLKSEITTSADSPLALKFLLHL